MPRSREQIIADLTAPGAMFEVTEGVVGGVTMPLFSTLPSTMVDLLRLTAAHVERECLVYGDERWTFGDQLRIVGGLAHHLRDVFGVATGDRVGIAMRNYPEWVFAFWACQSLGAIAVPLNAWWTGDEMAYAVNDAGLRLIIADGERAWRLAAANEPMDVLERVVVVRPGEERPGSESTAPSFDARRLLTPETRWDVVLWTDVLAALDPSAAVPDTAIGPDDDATIMYTSGTTGLPKGAVASHRNHLTNFMNTALSAAAAMTSAAEVAAEAGEPAGPAPADLPQPCSLQSFPFFHIGGLSGLYVSTGLGAKVVLMYKWDTAEAVRLIEREGVTTIAMVPTLLRRLLEVPDLPERVLATLTGIAAGAAPVPPDLIGRIESDLRRQVSPANGYGLTETTSAVVVNAADAYFAHPDSIGLPWPTVRLRVVDPTGEDVPAGEVGELCFLGPNIVRGYWNRPAATAEAFTDGWFHSGDLGRVGEDGFVYVVDRLKDVVIRAGENVYCAEVEAVLHELPAVFDVAVVGLPHRALGEEVAAVVQVRPGSTLSVDEVRRHAAGRLAAFKVPSRVFLWDETLPRNATGKVMKRQLRDVLAAADRAAADGTGAGDPRPAGAAGVGGVTGGGRLQ